ncbi:MAG: hypothetical protein C5B47_01345 [Verrucomicrobia bacterium]|nr:MAG: hypothetical protein C5B47_01345 [Verrucomicrobiota bacterium]
MKLKMPHIFSGSALGHRRISFGVALIVCSCLCLSSALPAASDPSDLFLKAYQEFQNGELLEKKNAPDEALIKYRYTASLLSQIQKANPDWQPTVVSYRLRKTQENIGRLELLHQSSSFNASATSISQASQTSADVPSVSITPPLGNSPASFKNIVNSPHSELKQLRLQLNEALQENQRLAAAMTIAEAQKQSALVEIDKIKVSLVEAKSQNSEAQSAADLAREQADRMTRLQESSQSRLTELQRRIAALDADNTVLTEENERLLNKLNQAASYIQESDKIRESLAQDRLALYKSERASQKKLKQVKDNDKLVAKLTAENQELATKNFGLSQKLADVQATIAQANTRTKNAETALKKLSEQQNSLLSTPFPKIKEQGDKLQRDQSHMSAGQVTKPAPKDVPPSVSNDASFPTHPLTVLNTSVALSKTLPLAIPSPAPAVSLSTSDELALPPEKTSLAKQAELAFKEGRLSDCESLYEALLEKNPNNASILANLGAIQSQLSKYISAERILRKALTLNPSDPFATTALGVLQLKCSRIEDAIETLHRSVKLDSQNFSAHNYLGIAYGEIGRLEEAERELKAAVELNPNYAIAHFNLAVLYSTQKIPNKNLARKHYVLSTNLGGAPDSALERLIH